MAQNRIICMMATALCAGTLFAADAPAPANNVVACTSAAENYYKQNRLTESETEFRRCISLQPDSPNIHVSLAGILTLQNKLKEAREEFLQALKLNPKPGTASYCYSRLGDIELRLGRNDDAGTHYKKAIEIDPKDVNAQIGLGRYYQEKRDWVNADIQYKTGLKLEPGNTIASDGLKKVEIYTMTDAEILEEMKLRKAVPPAKNDLAKETKDLFFEMRDAEEMGAIDYLKRKAKTLPAQYVVEKNHKDSPFRLFLTAKGFAAYKRCASNDALERLAKQKINSRTAFKIKALNGKPMFDDKGLLTADGLQIFYYLLIGEKKYLLPWDPPTPEAMALLSQEDREIENLKNKGYNELTIQEYAFLARSTDCTDATMVNNLCLVIKKKKDKTSRFFLPPDCPSPILGSLVARFRQGRSDDLSIKSTGFFGTGQVKAHKVCTPDGQLWNGL